MTVPPPSPESYTESKMKNEPIIQLAKPSDAFSLAKLAEKTFSGAFAKLNDKENFERYVELSFTENQIRSEILDSDSTFFIAKLNDNWVGYAKLNQGVPPDCVYQIPSIELARLYSMQEYLGCGIGDTRIYSEFKFKCFKGRYHTIFSLLRLPPLWYDPKILP